MRLRSSLVIAVLLSLAGCASAPPLAASNEREGPALHNPNVANPTVPGTTPPDLTPPGDPSVPAPSPSTATPGTPSPGTPSRGPNLELRSSATKVRLGDKITFSVVNTGDETFVFHHPGASNGCGAFHWTLDLHDAKTGAWFRDPSEALDRMCTMAIIPPRDILIPAGGQADIELDTGAERLTDHMSSKRAHLKPGTYTVQIGGAGSFSMEIEITAR